MNGFLLRSLSFTPYAVGSGFAAANPVGNCVNDFMGMVTRADVADTTIQIGADFGAPVLLDSFAALNVVGLSVTLFASTASDFATTPFSADLTAANTDTPTAQGRRHALWAVDSLVGPYRYWMFRLQGSPGVKAEVARLLFGQKLQPGRNFSFGAARGVNDLGSTDFAPRGAFLRRKAAKRRHLGLSWGYLTEIEAEQAALPLLEAVGNTEPLLAVLDPAADAERSRRLYYGPLQGNLALNWRGRDRWEKRIQMVSLV